MDPSRASVNVQLDPTLLPRLAARVGASSFLTAHRRVDLSKKGLHAKDCQAVNSLLAQAISTAMHFATAEVQRCRFSPTPDVLISLTLRENGDLGDEGVRAAVETLLESSASARVGSLSLAAVGAGDAGVCTLAAALTDAHCQLKLASLDLSSNRLSAVAAHALADALATGGSTLVELNLSRTAIGDEGAAALAQGLMRSSSIAKLDLGYCRIGSAGVRALAGGAAMRSSLSQLSLHGNQLHGGDGAQAANLLLVSVQTLRYLRLGEMQLGPAAARVRRT